MEKNFFDKTVQQQIKILDEENFWTKDEEKQIDSLRKKGFFEIDLSERIEFLEKAGIFHLDINDDPPTIPLTLEMVDYLNKKVTSKVKREIAYGSAERFLKSLIKDKKLIINEIKGIENLKNIETGAIITCNHFHPYDSFSVEYAFRKCGQSRKRKLYKVIREGNYTNFPGKFSFFLKNCDTLPLASNKKVMVEFMKSASELLQKNNFILVFPEQSMWLNYKKPKPMLQDGAYKLAVRNNVPILPIFINLEDSDVIGEDGNPVQAYVLNIAKPIYIDKKLNKKDNIENMKKQNFEVWKQIYEEFYKIKLEYKTENKNIKILE